jgi:hypothetical protein
VSFTQIPEGPVTRERGNQLYKEVPILDQDLREKIINEIISEIWRYFPNDRIKLMAVLNPKNLPENIISLYQQVPK